MIIANNTPNKVVAVVNHSEYGAGSEYCISSGEFARVFGLNIGNVDGEENTRYNPPGNDSSSRGMD